MATLALGMPAAASASNWGHGYDHRGDNDSLIKVNDNNVGPFQGCNNHVPTNVLGLQGSGEDGSGTAGLDNDGNSSSDVDACAQASEQNNDNGRHHRGGGDNDSLIKINDNNIGPFQVCNNNVPTNVLGGQISITDLVGVLGFDNDGNESANVDSCEQESEQDN